MTAIDRQTLKQDAAETIQGIDAGSLTKDAYILLGASLAILDHSEPGEVNLPMPRENPARVIMAHSVGKSLRELVEGELSGAEMYYAMGERDIAVDELRHADRFLTVLRAQANKDALNALIAQRDAIVAKL